MSIDKEVADLLRAERRRIASILRDVDEWLRGRDELDKSESALLLAAKYIEHGDDNGALYVECLRCTDYAGKRRRTELPFGYDSFGCSECGLNLEWRP